MSLGEKDKSEILDVYQVKDKSQCFFAAILLKSSR